MIPKDFFSNLDGSIRGLVKSRTNLDFSNNPSANFRDNKNLKNLDGMIEDKINCEDEKKCIDIDVKSFESERDIYLIGRKTNRAANLSKFHKELKEMMHDKKVSFDGYSDDELDEL